MAQTPTHAHSEQQTQTNTPDFILAARAARKAARQWFGGWPTETLAQWRDTCRNEHCSGLPNAIDRGAAFNEAFSREVGALIISGGRLND